MRVTQALQQSLLHRLNRRAPFWAGVICVALAATGCSSLTMLGEKQADVKGESGTAVVAAQGAQISTITPLQKFMWFFSPYRPDIQQGNFISEEMLAQLKTGMTRDQVRFILGTPLLTDIFHADRWDYPFRLAKGNGETITSSVVIYFKEGKVDRFEGGNLPTEKEYIALIAGPAKDAKKVLKAEAIQPSTAKAPLPSGTDASTPPPVQVTPEIKSK